MPEISIVNLPWAVGTSNLERYTYCYTNTKTYTHILFILKGYYKQRMPTGKSTSYIILIPLLN